MDDLTGTDPKGQIAKAVARSPELAAMLAADRPRRSRVPRRVALAAGGVAAGALAVWGAVASLSPKHEAAELDTSHYLYPPETAADPATGEESGPFSGFAVSVESDPPGALVTVAGIPRGEAPVIAGVDCKPGRKIEVRAEKAGLAPGVKSTLCRKDTLVKITVRLPE